MLINKITDIKPCLLCRSYNTMLFFVVNDRVISTNESNHGLKVINQWPYQWNYGLKVINQWLY